jgi:hypothetical protein
MSPVSDCRPDEPRAFVTAAPRLRFYSTAEDQDLTLFVTAVECAPGARRGVRYRSWRAIARVDASIGADAT